MVSGPLEGIRVLEFTQIIAGPFACQNLSDMGADVIKVEPPEGEPWRLASQFMPGESKTFQSLNRGKRSLVLDMARPEAQEVVHRLVPEMDVVVINYRPDVAERLRVDYPTLKALRPDLIYVDNTAFGRRGPWAGRPGYDIVVQGVSGLMAAEGKVDAESGAPGIIVSVAIADYATGLAMAWGVCAALYHRERTGRGQLVESTLLQTAMAVQNSTVFDLPAADEAAQMVMGDVTRLREEGHGYRDLVAAYSRGAWYKANIFYRGWETKDGAVVIGALSPPLREAARAALETDFLGSDDPDADLLDEAWLEQAQAWVREIEAKVREKTTAEWLEIFERHGVPCGPVRFPRELLDDPQVEANEMLVDLDHELSGPQRQVGPVLRMSDSPLAARGPSPPLGRDTDAILVEAGYDTAAIAALREQGAIA
ncbi:MAG: CaiB/BaiF CoA transferase family protein [Dehalococcoidia bacterium]